MHRVVVMNKFMYKALEEALEGLRRDGGPFGAVIVKNGKIIALGHNKVLGSFDPTAHAEIVAIRSASKKLRNFNLSGCEIYSSCEPCPMCLSAIYWARIKKVYYGATKKDAAKIGFDDEKIYSIFREGSSKEKEASKKISMSQLERKNCLKVFRVWKAKRDRVMY